MGTMRCIPKPITNFNPLTREKIQTYTNKQGVLELDPSCPSVPTTINIPTVEAVQTLDCSDQPKAYYAIAEHPKQVLELLSRANYWTGFKERHINTISSSFLAIDEHEEWTEVPKKDV